jgi:hypothetical protein
MAASGIAVILVDTVHGIWCVHTRAIDKQAVQTSLQKCCTCNAEGQQSGNSSHVQLQMECECANQHMPVQASTCLALQQLLHALQWCAMLIAVSLKYQSSTAEHHALLYTVYTAHLGDLAVRAALTTACINLRYHNNSRSSIRSTSRER